MAPFVAPGEIPFSAKPKPMWMRFFLCLFLSLGVWGESWVIRPGQGLGPLSLGQSLSEAEAALGKASRVQASESDPKAQLRTYSRGVLLLVSGEKKILGITLWEPSARSSEGLGVGATRRLVESRLGAGLARGPQQFAYANRGIGFQYDGQQKVERIFLFRPEAAQPLQGDRLIMAGKRCGELLLGAPLSQVEQAWGRAPVQQGKDLRWPDKGVGLMSDSGRVVAITLTTGDYVTPQGLKMGSSAQEVLKVLGKPEQRPGGNLFYPSKGIAFYLAGEVVSTVQIFAPMKAER